MAPRDPLAHLPAGACLVAFGAAWCGPWQLLSVTFDRLRTAGVELRLVDVDVHGDLAERYRIICLPTFCLMRDGREVRRVTGAVSYDALYALALGKKAR